MNREKGIEKRAPPKRENGRKAHLPMRGIRKIVQRVGFTMLERRVGGREFEGYA